MYSQPEPLDTIEAVIVAVKAFNADELDDFIEWFNQCCVRLTCSTC